MDYSIFIMRTRSFCMCAYSVMSTNPAYIAAGHDIRFQCTIRASTSPTPTHQKSGVAYVAFFFFFFFFLKAQSIKKPGLIALKGWATAKTERRDNRHDIKLFSVVRNLSSILVEWPASALQRPGTWNSNVGGTSAEGHWQAQDIRAVRLALENVRKKRLWGKLPSKQFSKGRKQRFRNSSR